MGVQNLSFATDNPFAVKRDPNHRRSTHRRSPRLGRVAALSVLVALVPVSGALAQTSGSGPTNPPEAKAQEFDGSIIAPPAQRRVVKNPDGTWTVPPQILGIETIEVEPGFDQDIRYEALTGVRINSVTYQVRTPSPDPVMLSVVPHGENPTVSGAPPIEHLVRRGSAPNLTLNFPEGTTGATISARSVSELLCPSPAAVELIPLRATTSGPADPTTVLSQVVSEGRDRLVVVAQPREGGTATTHESEVSLDDASSAMSYALYAAMVGLDPEIRVDNGPEVDPYTAVVKVMPRTDGETAKFAVSSQQTLAATGANNDHTVFASLLGSPSWSGLITAEVTRGASGAPQIAEPSQAQIETRGNTPKISGSRILSRVKQEASGNRAVARLVLTQADFGGPVTNMKATVIGTILGATQDTSVDLLSDNATVAVDLDADPTSFRFEVDLPFAQSRRVTLTVSALTPEVANSQTQCPGVQPMKVIIDGASQFVGTRGQGLAPGFARFPQVAIPDIEVALDPIDEHTLNAAAIVLGNMQQQVGFPLRVRLVVPTTATKPPAGVKRPALLTITESDGIDWLPNGVTSESADVVLAEATEIQEQDTLTISGPADQLASAASTMVRSFDQLTERRYLIGEGRIVPVRGRDGGASNWTATSVPDDSSAIEPTELALPDGRQNIDTVEGGQRGWWTSVAWGGALGLALWIAVTIGRIARRRIQR